MGEEACDSRSSSATEPRGFELEKTDGKGCFASGRNTELSVQAPEVRQGQENKRTGGAWGTRTGGSDKGLCSEFGVKIDRKGLERAIIQRD